MNVPERSTESRLNRAFGCFAFLGLAASTFGLFALLLNFGLLKDYWGLLFEIFLYFPLLVAMLIVSVCGIVQTVRLRHSALVVLSAIAITCATLMLTLPNGGGGSLGVVTGIAAGIFLAANVLIPAWWFIFGRQRYRGEAFLRE